MASGKRRRDSTSSGHSDTSRRLAYDLYAADDPEEGFSVEVKIESDSEASSRGGSQRDSSQEAGPSALGHDGDGDAESEHSSRFEETYPWVRWMNGTLTPKTRADPVAWCKAMLLSRDRIRPTFWTDMEKPTEQTSCLAFALFDRYGRLRKEFKDHPADKGSGIWGDELNSGDLLLIEDLAVEGPYRRRGLGRKLGIAVLNKARATSERFIAVVSPVVVEAEIESEVFASAKKEDEVVDRHYGIVKAFFRSLGFRRVGSSRWFALASYPDHPCHNLDAAADFNPPTPPTRTVPLGLGNHMLWSENVEDLALLKELTHDFWLATDSKGNTWLHWAAKSSKPKTVQWLLAQNTRLVGFVNDAGYTALDALEFHLERQRTIVARDPLVVDISDKFKGFSQDSVECLRLLRNLGDTSEIDTLRLKYGCSCGQCVAGFMSMRMAYAIRRHAERLHDTITDLMERYPGPGFVSALPELHVVLPTTVLEDMETDRSIRQGFASLFTHFATCVQRGRLPALTDLRVILNKLQGPNEWPPNSRKYLERGGTMYAVGSLVFQYALYADEVAGADDPLAPMDEREDIGGHRAELASLPVCRNDLEYGFVSRLCGYKGASHSNFMKPYQS